MQKDRQKTQLWQILILVRVPYCDERHTLLSILEEFLALFSRLWISMPALPSYLTMLPRYLNCSVIERVRGIKGHDPCFGEVDDEHKCLVYWSSLACGNGYDIAALYHLQNQDPLRWSLLVPSTYIFLSVASLRFSPLPFILVI